MDIDVNALDFIIASNHEDKLTINAQELLKEKFLCQARMLANQDDSTDQFSDKVYRHYYDVLAAFMQNYPSVVIDLILIKLDTSRLN